MFVDRKDGVIYGTWTVRQWKDQEELPDDHAEVVAFVSRVLPVAEDKADRLRSELEAKGVLTKR